MFSKFTTTKILIIGLIFTTLGLIALFLFQKLKPPPPPPLSPPIIAPLNPNTSNILVNQTELSPSLAFPLLPHSLPVYQAKSTPISLAEIAQKLALHFNLQPDPSLENLWINSDKSQILTLSPRYQSLTYLIDQNRTPQPYQGTPPDLTAATNTGLDFISTVLGWNHLSPQRDQVLYLKTANLIQIPFIQQIDNYPVYSTNQIQPPLKITFGQANTIVKLEITPQLITDILPLNNYPLVAEKVARQLILSGKGTLISAVSQQILDTPLSQLPQLTLESIALEYRFDPYQNLVLPYLRFDGNATLPQQNKIHIILILPAIDTKYLLAP